MSVYRRTPDPIPSHLECTFMTQMRLRFGIVAQTDAPATDGMFPAIERLRYTPEQTALREGRSL
jgi:hypothetical protein